VLRRADVKLTQSAVRLLTLDSIYTRLTGVVLKHKSAPEYFGPMYQWPCRRADVRKQTLDALVRLRTGRQAGVHGTTEFVALNYFASIWPRDLAWPPSIPRPSDKKDTA
jgi:hypothetical protein